MGMSVQAPRRSDRLDRGDLRDVNGCSLVVDTLAQTSQISWGYTHVVERPDVWRRNL
jgi:hypothetical protein